MRVSYTNTESSCGDVMPCAMDIALAGPIVGRVNKTKDSEASLDHAMTSAYNMACSIADLLRADMRRRNLHGMCRDRLLRDDAVTVSVPVMHTSNRATSCVTVIRTPGCIGPNHAYVCTTTFWDELAYLISGSVGITIGWWS